MADDWRHGGFGLYIHWPFCAAKCPYCDFNSHVTSQIDFDRWQTAYLAELDRTGAETAGRVLNSVYFGGGTPSLMPPGLVGAILERLPDHWRLANDLEITLEANPSSVEAERFAGYRAAGVNRVSLGVQALNDADLRALGRLHDVEQALRALDVAKSTFERVNFDLIYARQHQSLADWQAELARALAFGPDHLSLYQLTIEDGTAFGDRFRRGKLPGLPDEDIAADMYFATQELCEAAGLPAYEVSNHAKPGQESRHNLIYWRGGDYLGIGPGAHGRITHNGTRYATETELSPARWLDLVAQNGTGETLRDALSRKDHAGEYLMMSLRTLEGTDLARITALGEEIKQSKINELCEIGLLLKDGHMLRATHEGRAVLNQIIAALLPE
ncbi:radical SAM family heme chaperone HemW [Sinisalibacter aestuarii]|uniref:Heme chaperone HemW n=1 Tax=Sinisalibacter aestuarii TaxID=2949426 RepID=A0ABQ5LQA3_9RHOB|nr:radical SAM family heme chaperone HemW [Sinisalibacter aestuarii]GKY86456.1 coproporphyrinogen III oxidase [Sinisalibacter aestuarii]